MFLWLTMVILSACSLVTAKEPRFGIRGDPVGWGGSCAAERNSVLAGAVFLVDVCNRADQPRQLRTTDWPEGYALEAALDLPFKAPFVPTEGLVESLRPIPYLSSATQSQQQRLKSGDLDDVDVGWLNLKSFVLRMPADLAGHTITLRARCDKGGKSRYTVPLEPIKIVLPCDRYDTARVIAGEVYLAWETGPADRIIEIADSMLSVGLSDAAVWKWAMYVCRGRGLIDKEIAYLDRMYEDFGVTNFVGTCGPRHDPNRQPNQQQQQSYQRTRARLVELKDQQQQH